VTSRRAAAIFRAIAYYEIIGAAWSLETLFRVFTHTPGGVIVPWSWVALILGFYGLVMAGGALLLKRRELGDLFSIIAQGIQVLQITVGPVAFRLVSGLQASIYLVGKHITYYLGITASVALWRGDDDAPFAIGINLIPLAILVIFAYLPSSPEVARAMAADTAPRTDCLGW
jgi:hypothetical protein